MASVSEINSPQKAHTNVLVSLFILIVVLAAVFIKNTVFGALLAADGAAVGTLGDRFIGCDGMSAEEAGEAVRAQRFISSFHWLVLLSAEPIGNEFLDVIVGHTDIGG